MCPVSPFMHAMINGVCCDAHSEPIAIPAQVTREFAVESAHDAFQHALAEV